MGFVQRAIGVSIQKAQGTFSGTSGADTINLQGLRVSATITNAATPAQALASVRIFGLTLSEITQLATFGYKRNSIEPNTITITAGNIGQSLTTVFQGTIITAEPDFQGAPSVVLNIEAQGGAYQLVQNTKPVSYNGSTSAASVMQNLASQGGYTFENNGVNTQLSSPYFWGSLGDQMRQCAQQAGFDFYIDETNTLAIWSPGQARTKQGPTIVAPPPAGNMISYPTFGNPLLYVKNLFDPSVKMGTQIKIQSSLQPANGIWNVIEITHELEAEVFGGKWHSLYGVYSADSSSPVPTAPASN